MTWGVGERRGENVHLCATILSTLILEKRIDRKKNACILEFTEGNSTTTHLCKHHFTYNTYLLPQNPAMELQNQERVLCSFHGSEQNSTTVLETIKERESGRRTAHK